MTRAGQAFALYFPANCPRNSQDTCPGLTMQPGAQLRANLFLMHVGFLQVSVGRLGIITQLTLRIIPQLAVQRSLAQISDAQFAQQVKLTQDAYTSALSSGNQSLVDAALSQLDETQVRSPRTFCVVGNSHRACQTDDSGTFRFVLAGARSSLYG